MNDDGVSQILGAIMVVSIMMTSMATMQNNFVPLWTEEAEHNHIQEVINDFGRLKTVVEGHQDNQTSNPTSIPMSLKPGTSGRWLRTEVLPARAEFTPTQSEVSIDAQTFHILRQNDRDQSLLSEVWSETGGTETVEAISAVDSLRLRMTSPPGVKLEFKKNAFVRLDLMDANDEFAGMFMAYVPEKEKEDVWIRVINADGNILVDQEFASDVKYKEHSQFWVDTLDPSWPWDAVMGAADAPFSIELTFDFPELDPNKWPKVEYAIAYRTMTESGRHIYAGGSDGKEFHAYDRTRNGGVLSYETRHKQLPDMHLYYEHGALINVQGDRSAMLMPPTFTAESDGAVLLLDASFPLLVGPADTISRGGSVTLIAKPESVYSLVALTDQLTFTLETEHAGAWSTFFETTLSRAGFSEGSGYFLSSTATNVTLTVEGPSSDDRVQDIQFYYWEPQVRVSFD